MPEVVLKTSFEKNVLSTKVSERIQLLFEFNDYYIVRPPVSCVLFSGFTSP